MRPTLVYQLGFGLYEPRIEIADFTDGARPAVRVKCHCRNCGWEGQARFKVKTKIELWGYCPKCERPELSCHGGFVSRDEMSQDEVNGAAREAAKQVRENARAMWNVS